jgi:hypothetical protein
VNALKADRGPNTPAPIINAESGNLLQKLLVARSQNDPNQNLNEISAYAVNGYIAEIKAKFNALEDKGQGSEVSLLNTHI